MNMRKILLQIIAISLFSISSFGTDVKIKGSSVLLKGNKHFTNFVYTPSRMNLSINLEGNLKSVFKEKEEQKLLNFQYDPKNKTRVLYSYENHPIDSANVRIEESKEHSRIHLMFMSGSKLPFTLNFDLNDELINLAEKIIIPDGDGLMFDPSDPLWVSYYDGTCLSMHEDLSMPLIALKFKEGQVGFWTDSPFRSKVCFKKNSQNKISFSIIHEGVPQDYTQIFELVVATTVPKTIFNWKEPSLVDMGYFYRQYLDDNHELYTMLFESKKKFRPEISKLAGSEHIYVWGTGNDVEFLDDLKNENLNNLVLIYEPEDVNQKFIERAKNYGYLVGPYDSFMNVQDPKNVDSFSSLWDEELFLTGAIIKESGEPLIGFNGRGFYLSSQALMTADQDRKLLRNRVSYHKELGINSFFLDCDAFGDFRDDFSTIHPMTKIGDRANRLKRMSLLSINNKFVLGSETAKPFSFGVVDYSHGNHSVANREFYNLMRDSSKFGGWTFKEGKPEILFKKVNLDEKFKKRVYGYEYRIPLLQSAFHDSIQTLDRWEASYLKFPEVSRERELLDLLYLSPAIWNLDRKTFKENLPFIKKHYQFFSKVLIAGFDATLIKYEREENGKWHRAKYRLNNSENSKKEFSVTVNFDTKVNMGVSPLCAQVELNGQKLNYCPDLISEI